MPPSGPVCRLTSGLRRKLAKRVNTSGFTVTNCQSMQWSMTGLLREFTRVRGELLAGSGNFRKIAGNEQVILGATLALISLSS